MALAHTESYSPAHAFSPKEAYWTCPTDFTHADLSRHIGQAGAQHKASNVPVPQGDLLKPAQDTMFYFTLFFQYCIQIAPG